MPRYYGRRNDRCNIEFESFATFLLLFPFFRTNDLEKKSSKLKMIRGAQNQTKVDLNPENVSELHRCDLCP